jgi:threonine/homoserine/homoserine lactone efflux protein
MAVRLVLWGHAKIHLNNKIFKFIMPISALFLIYLTISSFLSYTPRVNSDLSSFSIPLIKSSFVLGLLLSALNPLQFPFWMGWNTYLLDRKILNNNFNSYFFYMFGIGLGTLTGLMLFIFLGTNIAEIYQHYKKVITILIGLLYLGFSLYILHLFYKYHLG